jgi:hypothetical protein
MWKGCERVLQSIYGGNLASAWTTKKKSSSQPPNQDFKCGSHAYRAYHYTPNAVLQSNVM